MAKKNRVSLESKLPQLHISVNLRTLHVMIQPKRAEIVDILMINFPLLSSHSFFTLSQCNTRNHKHYTPNENAMQTPNGTIIIKCVKSPPVHLHQPFCISTSFLLCNINFISFGCCIIYRYVYDTGTHTHRSSVHRFCHILYYFIPR